MPRLTNKDFLARHHFLAALWEDPLLRSMFSALEPMEQMHLHQYFQAINLDGDDAVLETRTTVNKGDKVLPQQAGRAWNHLVRIYMQTCALYGVDVQEDDLLGSIKPLGLVAERARDKITNPEPRKLRNRKKPGRKKANGKSKVHEASAGGRHTVRAIMNPEMDKVKFARTLLLLALHHKQAEAEQRGETVDTKIYGDLMEQLEKDSRG